MSNLTKAEFRKPGADQWVYIATPAHTIHSNFHVSLLRTVPLLIEAGIGVTYAHLAGHCHVDDARNLLVADCLKSGATDLQFWDADVAAEPGAALNLLHHKADIVGGVYPFKDGSGKFPVRLIGLNGAREPGLSEAEMVPTGFLRIRAEVLRRMAASSMRVTMDGQVDVPLIFGRGIRDGERIGGDAAFCLKARAMGCKVYVDPSLMFTHQGPVDFAGRLSDHLNQSEAAQ